MKKFFTLIAVHFIALTAFAQSTAAVPGEEKFGKVSLEDLKMQSCDFEKDANAEVLFDVCKMTRGFFIERHVRVKIFNDAGKNAANVRIEYPALNGGYSAAAPKGLMAETINLENGKIDITPLEKSQIFTEQTSRFYSTMSFALPNVKAGSIIEFTYQSFFDGVWYFQGNFPTRYSEIQTDFPSNLSMEFRFIAHVKQPFVKNEGAATDYRQVKALANIPSLPKEPFNSNWQSSLQRVDFISENRSLSTWNKLGELLAVVYDHDQNIDTRIPGEQDILAKAKALKTDNEKIALLYDYVKNYLTWNEISSVIASQPASYTWNTKTGNSTDINWIIFHLLKKAHIQAYALILSDPKNGRMNPTLPNIIQFNKMVVYVPLDTVNTYVLDGTNKYNLYSEIPKEQLNTFGLTLDEPNNLYKMVFLSDENPVMQQAFFNADVTSDGKMAGTAEITSDSYNKIDAIRNYQTLGEKRYLDSLRNGDNNIRISSFSIQNMDVDTLPLVQKINFTANLPGTDEHYIYFNTNPFLLMGANPFKNETRFADIDFGYRRDYSISGMYKIPAGYGIEAIPKTITLVMPDKSIIFKRTVAQDNGTIVVRYLIDHRKSIYFSDNYPDIRTFYQKMYELLNEQIVLKKS